MRKHGLEEGDVGDDAVDPEFAERARGLGDNIMPGVPRCVHDDLCQQ